MSHVVKATVLRRRKHPIDVYLRGLVKKGIRYFLEVVAATYVAILIIDYMGHNIFTKSKHYSEQIWDYPHSQTIGIILLLGGIVWCLHWFKVCQHIRIDLFHIKNKKS
jgi:hypothetical protein